MAEGKTRRAGWLQFIIANLDAIWIVIKWAVPAGTFGIMTGWATLASRFTTERIRMVDLAPPVGGFIRDKVFDDCDIIGPANIMFQGCHFQQNGGEIVDGVIVKEGSFPRNGFGFINCTFRKCRFYMISFMVPGPEYQSFTAWNWTGLNWITALPETPTSPSKDGDDGVLMGQVHS